MFKVIKPTFQWINYAKAGSAVWLVKEKQQAIIEVPFDGKYITIRKSGLEKSERWLIYSDLDNATGLDGNLLMLPMKETIPDDAGDGE